jgi:uncharacterized pyridoxamine 5'-phosphate oxidase family protein
MSDFDTLCNQLGELDKDTFGQIFNAKSVDVIAKLSQLTSNGTDGVTAYLHFILASVAADGKLSEGEYKLLKPMFDDIADKDVSYEEAQNMFLLMGLDQPETFDKAINTMVDIIGLVDEDLKDDIIMLCLLVCAVDGVVSEKEKAWIKQLAQPLTIEVTPMEYISRYLTEAKTFTLATVCGDRPRTRVLGLKIDLDDKIYFAVGTFKNVYKQLKANPKCEIIASVGTDFLRWNGCAEFSDDPRLFPKFKEALPEVAKMYYDNGWTLAYFTIVKGTAEVVDVSGKKTKLF